jgi:hypothetical protein
MAKFQSMHRRHSKVSIVDGSAFFDGESSFLREDPEFF